MSATPPTLMSPAPLLSLMHSIVAGFRVKKDSAVGTAMPSIYLVDESEASENVQRVEKE
jgi:hypothetical protein